MWWGSRPSCAALDLTIRACPNPGRGAPLRPSPARKGPHSCRTPMPPRPQQRPAFYFWCDGEGKPIQAAPAFPPLQTRAEERCAAPHLEVCERHVGDPGLRAAPHHFRYVLRKVVLPRTLRSVSAT